MIHWKRERALKAKLRQTFTCKLKLSDALTDVNQQNENLKKDQKSNAGS
jgi:hypothetical protein